MSYVTPFDPSELYYDAQRLDVLDKHFEKLQNQGILQGSAYCLSKNDKILALGATGQLRQEESEKMVPNAMFKIASITKLFTTVAVMKLVEDGYFRLDEPVSVLLEEFKEAPFDKITFAQLLMHTSGLQADEGCFPNPYFLSPWECVERGFKEGSTNWVKSSLRAGLRKEPGTEWAYSTFGFTLLGAAITKASGCNAEEFIEKEILAPCDMNDSGFEGSFKKEKLDRFSYGNHHHKEFYDRVSQGSELSEIEKMWMMVPDTGGGMISTVEDLSRFGNMLLNQGYYHNKRILGRKAIEKITTRQTGSDIKEYCWGNNGVERAYGLGPDLRNNFSTVYTPGTFFHEGWGSCCLMMDPKEQFVASWYVPYPNGDWHAEGLYNASSIMWSGLK